MYVTAAKPAKCLNGSVDQIAPAFAYCQRHSARFLAELKQFIRFPSVSTQPRHADDLKRCAAWLADHLLHIGLQRVSVIPTARHPIVYAEWRAAPQQPTVLIYGHYDVQPPEPMNEWKTPPFEPTLIGDNLFGRGASDDKGQMFVHVKAMESYLRSTGELPVNVLCLFEGEEEIGSPNLGFFLRRYCHELTADIAVISDMPMLAPHRPAITESMRGALSLELDVRNPERALHSGLYGGAIHNPLQAVCEIISAFHDKSGRVRIPGFYDSVRDRDPRERAFMQANGPGDAEFLRNAGARVGWGEPGFTAYERTTIRPALTVNGIIGGYQGIGPKAVIADRAVAKLDFRLVPDQDPDGIEYLFRRYIEYITPATVRALVYKLGSARPVAIERQLPAMRAVCCAYRSVFGVTPVFLRSGGTIPVIALFQDILGLDTLLMGFALPDDGMHAPNEQFHLPNFFNGISTSIHFLTEIADQSTKLSVESNHNFEFATPAVLSD